MASLAESGGQLRRPAVDADSTAPPELHKQLLAGFPAGVTVVTAFDADRRPRGLTITAFAGVSLSPPLVLVCVDRQSNTLPAIRVSRGFTVNIMSTAAVDVCRLMASKSPDKFDGVDWSRPANREGGPVLHGHSTAHIACRTWREIDAGDRVIFIGVVTEGRSYEDNEPLVFHRRNFLRLASRDSAGEA